MRVMVVDDEQDVQFMFQQRFRKEEKAGRIALQFAFSGEEALSQLTNSKPAEIFLILTDINMPGMSGLDLLRELKQRYALIKVFMITAYNDEEKYRTAKNYGCDGYFTKPIDFDILKKKIFGE
ncbi:MAG: response regulator [candidate division KSB1 bacterium]|nr:response regulator [candidate division KSB1 bacterium]MDZ7369379.1 response regulator [candidate division KSB1 bacterium]MDZ7407469.1 response regulator [candidate division KSB1 bacterium]